MTIYSNFILSMVLLLYFFKYDVILFLQEKEDDQVEQEGDEQDDIDDVELEEEEEGKKVTHEMIAKWKSGLEVRPYIFRKLFRNLNFFNVALILNHNEMKHDIEHDHCLTILLVSILFICQY